MHARVRLLFCTSILPFTYISFVCYPPIVSYTFLLCLLIVTFTLPAFHLIIQFSPLDSPIYTKHFHTLYLPAAHYSDIH